MFEFEIFLKEDDTPIYYTSDIDTLLNEDLDVLDLDLKEIATINIEKIN